MLKKGFWLNATLVILLACLIITGIAVGEALAKEKKNITIVLWHTMKPSEVAFKKVVDGVYDVKWTELSAGQDKNKLDEILKSIDPAKTDLVYTYGTTVSLRAKEIIKDIPVIFNIVAEPTGVGLIDSWEHSGSNLVGGSIRVPPDILVKTLREIVNFKNLGVIYNPKEKQTTAILAEIKSLEDKYGYKVIPAAYGDPGELESAMLALKEGKADAVMGTAASIVMANPGPVAEALIKLKIPIMIQNIETVDKGMLIALGANYGKLGEKVGEIALRVLKGEKPNDIPTAVLEKFDMKLNLKTANMIGVKIPLKILKMATEIVE